MRPAAALLLLLLLPACTSDAPGRSARTAASTPVPVPVPTASASALVSSCSALLRAVPQVIGNGLSRRAVAGDPLRTAAWGDPAVTLQCGVPAPPRTESPIQLGPDDAGPLVAFTTRGVGSATRFTTSDTVVRVAVTVPDVYDSQVLLTLTGSLRALPLRSPSPTASPSTAVTPSPTR